jgi:hypothetical protein
MNRLRFVSTGLVALIVFGCMNGTDVNAPTGPSAAASVAASASPNAAQPVQTSGSFDAIVDFQTVTLTPKGRNCLLQVQGHIVFHGTIEGTANGVTSALEFAPCSEVAVNPPGTFPDEFKSVAVFDGTVAGQPAHANLLYMGRVQVGGAIDGRFVFSNGVAGELKADAIVAVGGTYRGQLVVH